MAKHFCDFWVWKRDERRRIQQSATKIYKMRSGTEGWCTHIHFRQYSCREQMTPTCGRFWTDTTRWFLTENSLVETFSTWCRGWEKPPRFKDDADRVSWMRNWISKYRETTTESRIPRGTNFWTQNVGQRSSLLGCSACGHSWREDSRLWSDCSYI